MFAIMPSPGRTCALPLPKRARRGAGTARGGRVSAPAQVPPALKGSMFILEWHRLSHAWSETSADALPSRNCCTFGDALALQSFRQRGPRPRRPPREPQAKLRWRLRILQGTPTFYILLADSSSTKKSAGKKFAGGEPHRIARGEFPHQNLAGFGLRAPVRAPHRGIGGR